MQRGGMLGKPTYEDLEKRIAVLEKELADREQSDNSRSVMDPDNFRHFIENSTNLFYSHTPDHVLTYLSPQVVSLLGYTPEEAMIKWTLLASDNPVNTRGIELTVEATRTGLPQPAYELELVHKDGHKVWVEVREVPVTRNGRTVAVVGALTDITDRKQAEETLKKSESQKKAILDASVDIILYLDPDMRIIWANREAWKSIGHDGPEAIVGKHCYDVYLKSDQPCQGCSCLRSMKTGKTEYATYHKKGVTGIGDSWWENIGVPLKDESGIVIGAIEIDRNVTARKKAEMEVIKAQNAAAEHKKLAMVGQVAGKLAHDFNNILGSIMGNAELSLMDCDDEEACRTFQLILEQTLRGRNLTRNLVAFAKDQELNEEFFSVREKINLVVNLLRKDLDGIRLERDDAPDVPELLADPGMMEHALVNILQNAIHATSRTPEPRVAIRSRTNGHLIRVEIEDNGCGIQEKDLASIFEPAFTLKGRKDREKSYGAGIDGTGYGMANVKKTIEQHKGTVAVSSRFGSGTTVVIELPVIRKELTVQEQAILKNSGHHQKKTILLVEDEEDIARVQQRILMSDPLNHKVDVATDALSAMAMADNAVYDIVCLDYFLPGPHTGMDVYRHIRRKNAFLPILFISGNIEFLESIKALKLKDPLIGHLSKPALNMDYVAGINALLDQVFPASLPQLSGSRKR